MCFDLKKTLYLGSFLLGLVLGCEILVDRAGTEYKIIEFLEKFEEVLIYWSVTLSMVHGI